MNGWLIDEQGIRHPDLPRDLCRRFDNDDAAVTFAVEQMGFVFAARRNDIAEIRFDKQRAEPEALIGLLYWLKDFNLKRATFLHSDVAGPITLRTSYSACIEYVAHIAETRMQGCQFLNWQVPIEISPFGNRFDAAMELCYQIEDSQIRDTILDRLFQGMFLLSERTDGGRFSVVGIGSGYRKFADNLADKFILSSRFDAKFAEWAERTYLDVLKTNKPRCDDVDALVDWPTQGQRRHKYSRLIMPVTTRAGQSLVLTAIHSSAKATREVVELVDHK